MIGRTSPGTFQMVFSNALGLKKSRNGNPPGRDCLPYAGIPQSGLCVPGREPGCGGQEGGSGWKDGEGVGQTALLQSGCSSATSTTRFASFACIAIYLSIYVYLFIYIRRFIFIHTCVYIYVCVYI